MKNFRLIRWLLAFVKPLWLLMSGAVLLGILSNLVVIVIPVLAAQTTYQIFIGNQIQLAPILISLIICGFIRGICRYLEQYLNHSIAFRLLAIIRGKIFSVLRQLGPAKTTGKKSGDLITAITSDVEALEVFFAHTVSPALIALATTILTVGFLASYKVELAFLLLLGQISVGVLLPVKSYLKYQKIGDQYQTSFVQLNQDVMENIASLQDIEQYSLQQQKLEQLETDGNKLNLQYLLRIKQGSRLRIAGEFLLIATSLTILLASSVWQLPKETVLLATVLSLSSFGPVLALNGLGNDLLLTLASARRIYALTNEKTAISFGTHEKIGPFENLSLDKVHFSYEEKQKVLDAVSLSVESGEWLGIGGESGSGKSTLLKLLMRYWDPDSGRIELDNVTLNKLTESAPHQLEGLMEQQTFIFEATILENIRLGNLNISDEQVKLAAKQAAIDTWIRSLPDGYQTKIGGQYRSLSDGERQRLGIARLLVYDAPLVLLDEPTSNLDYMNESSILKTLSQEFQTKIVLLISHRPTTLAAAKKCLVMENGKLIDLKE